MAAALEDLLELLRYIEIFKRRKRLFCLVLSASVILSLLVLLLIRPTYKSTAKILIAKTTVTNVLLANWGLTSQVTSTGDDIKTDLELSKLKPLAEAIIKEYKLKGAFGSPLKTDNFFDATFFETLFSLPYAVVKQYREASMMEIGIVTMDPDLSASIANTLSAYYVEGSIERVKTDFKSVKESIELKLQTVRDDYFKYLALSRDIKIKDMSVDLTSETSNIIKTISTLKTEMETIDKEVVQLDTEITKGAKQLRELAVFRKENFEMSKNSRLETLKSSLDEKILERASQKLDFTKEHPKYKILNEEIETIKKQMSEEAELVLSREVKSLNPVHTELSRKILMNYISKEVALAKKAVIQKFTKLYEEELIKIPLKYEESARLEPVLTAHKDMYVRFNQYAMQAALAEAINVSKLKVVEPATPPKKRFYPRRGRTLASALFMGIFLGLAAVFFAEYMDKTVKSKSDLTASSRLLGRIPYSRQLRNYEAFSALGEGSKEIEAINELKDNIFFYETISKGSGKALIVTSPNHGDGKTSIASLLAIAYAREGLRVVLVAAGGGTAAFFGMDAMPASPMPTRHNGLDVLTVPELTNEIVTRLHGTYGRVIIDTGSLRDCVSLEGSVICVAEPHKYEKDTLDRVQDITKDNFAGYVFNKDMRPERPFDFKKLLPQKKSS
ncbi:MAG: hypothetical protein HQL01_02970 [Nitrospirae bacterium]|nr:hypothetical protein [Nitrospirota bacterium]